MSRTHRLLVVAGVTSVVLTVALLVTPLRYAYESTELRVAVETSQALIAALVAFLVYGRYRRTELSADLAIVYSFGVSAATNLFFAVTRDAAHPAAASADGRFQAWAPLILRLISAVVLAWAATSAPRRLPLRHPRGALLAAITGTTSIVLVLAAVFADVLPRGITLEPTDPSHYDLDAPVPLLALQLVLMVVFALAAWGFARQANDEEPLLQALAAGCVLAAAARLHFFMYPSLYSDIVHIGDLVRLGFYAVLLGGAAQQIVLYWRAEAEAAAIGERRRMARDLHDGLNQELAFIRSHTASLAAGRGDPRVLEHVADAAERALDRSRRAVAAMSPSDSSELGSRTSVEPQPRRAPDTPPP